jgi:proteasome lid subunit RPN8/RPN11
VISELYGLAVVGWYHSHPSFPALPSVIDIANQLQMQQQVRAAVHAVTTRCGYSLHYVEHCWCYSSHHL